MKFVREVKHISCLLFGLIIASSVRFHMHKLSLPLKE